MCRRDLAIRVAEDLEIPAGPAPVACNQADLGAGDGFAVIHQASANDRAVGNRYRLRFRSRRHTDQPGRHSASLHSHQNAGGLSTVGKFELAL